MGVVGRGDVWLTVLDPAIGGEIRKVRPCLVVSPDLINDFGRNFLIVPMTTGGGRPMSFRPLTDFGGKPGRLLPDQLRSVDRARFVKHLGRIDDATLHATLTILQQMFAR